jgi:hypothetical protein
MVRLLTCKKNKHSSDHNTSTAWRGFAPGDLLPQLSSSIFSPNYSAQTPYAFPINLISATCSTHLILVNLSLPPKNILLREHIMTLFIMQLPASSCYIILLMSKYSQCPVLKQAKYMFFLSFNSQDSHPYKIIGKQIILD